MYTTLSLSLKDTREKYCGMEFLLNGRYIVVIGYRDIFIMMDDDAKKHIDKKLMNFKYAENGYETQCKDNHYFVTHYEYTILKISIV